MDELEVINTFHGMVDENVERVLKSAKVLKHKKLQEMFIIKVVEKLIKKAY